MGSRPQLLGGRLCAGTTTMRTGCWPAWPGWAAGQVQTQILNRLGLGMPASRILSLGRFIQMLSPLAAVPGTTIRLRLVWERVGVRVKRLVVVPVTTGTHPHPGHPGFPPPRE